MGAADEAGAAGEAGAADDAGEPGAGPDAGVRLEPDAAAASVEKLFVGRVPHNRALGMRVLRFGQGRAVTALPWHPRLVGNPETGVLHGGSVTALVDATCGAAVFARMRSPTPIATLDLRIDYLRPAAQGERVVCEAECDKVSKHVAFVRAVAHDGDRSRAVATASGTFMVFGDRGVSGSGLARSRGGSKDAPDPSSRPSPSPSPSPEAQTTPPWSKPAGPGARAMIDRARESGDLTELVASIPYAGFLGLSPVASPEGRGFRLAYRESNIGNAALPALHGGTTGALLESAALFEVLMRAGAAVPRTINLTIDYLRSAGPKDTRARATIIRQGRRVASVHATAWQDDPDRPIATALVHVLISN